MVTTRVARKPKKKRNDKRTQRRLKIKVATKLHELFAQRRTQQDDGQHDRPGPLQLAQNAIRELQTICDERTRKQLALYSARKVKTGLKGLYRDMQQAGARARTLLNELVDYAVREHSHLLRSDGKPVGRSIPIPSVQDMVGDLDALEAKYGLWRATGDSLSITTAPIILEDRECGAIDFGAFKIRLQLTADAKFAYTTTPLVPIIVDGYPHPHVSGDQMCEGQAEHALRHARDNGLLFEFFVIVINTLKTYNENSPYAVLQEWLTPDGDTVRCAWCDSRMPEEDSYSCNTCDNLVCDYCHAYCDAGECRLCNGCIEHYRQTKSGCRYCGRLGAEGCIIRENPPCDECGEVKSDAKYVRCSLTGRNLCPDCLAIMVADDAPCNTASVSQSGIKVNMGRRRDGVCRYVCVGADDAGGCLLRDRGYEYEPKKKKEDVVEQTT